MSNFSPLARIFLALSFVAGTVTVCPAQTSSGGLASALGEAETQQAMAEAKQVAIACKLYAVDHEGSYPHNLEELVPEYLPNKKLIARFECLGGIDTPTAKAVLLRSKALTKDGHRIMVHSDASVELVAP